MITTSNFFNKSIFNAEDELENEPNDLGPWFMKQRKFVTLDAERKKQIKSQLRYNHTFDHQVHSNLSNRIQSKLAPQDLHFSLEKQSMDINQKAKIVREKNKNDFFLPPIMNSSHKISTRNQSISVNMSMNSQTRNLSPLAYQLNFIIKKQMKNSKNKYLPQMSHNDQKAKESISKFLNPTSLKYNIYEKCVVQVKRNNFNKSKQLVKHASKEISKTNG